MLSSWVVGFVVVELSVVLLAYFYFLEPHDSRDGQRRAQRTQGLRLHIENGRGGGGAGFEFDLNRSGAQSPRILTLLTTYHGRTAFARANREAMEKRADGYESLVRASHRSGKSTAVRT